MTKITKSKGKLALVASFFFLLASQLSATILSFEVRGKGNGTVNVTANGSTVAYPFWSNPTTTEWELTPVKRLEVSVDDGAEYDVTVSASNMVDYHVIVTPLHEYRKGNIGRRGTRRGTGAFRRYVTLDGRFSNVITKSEIVANTFVARSNAATTPLFGFMDTSDLAAGQVIKFGLGSGESDAGILVYHDVPHYYFQSSYGWGTPSPNEVLEFYPGGTTLWSKATTGRIQAQSHAGFVDATRNNDYFVIKFYKPGSYTTLPDGFKSLPSSALIKTYTIDVSETISNDHPISGWTWQDGRLTTIERDIDGDVRVFEYRGDYYHKQEFGGSYWSGGYPGGGINDIDWHYYKSHKRIWPWRKSGASRGFLTKVESSASQEVHEGYIGLVIYPFSNSNITTTRYAGSTDATTLRDRVWGNYRSSHFPFKSPPSTHTKGSGNDEFTEFSNTFHHLSGLQSYPIEHRTESNRTGGKVRTYEFYKNFFAGGGNLGGRSELVVGLPKEQRVSFLDNDVGTSSDLVTTYEYSELFGGTMIRPSLEVTTKGGVTIGKRTYGYTEGTFNPGIGSLETLTTQRNNYAKSSVILTTTTKSFTGRVIDKDFQNRPISVVRPDLSKTSFGYQRGTLSSSGVWTKSTSGPHFRTVVLDGKQGSGVSSFKLSSSDSHSIPVDGLAMESVSESGYVVGRSTAGVSVFNAYGLPIFEGTYTYSGGIFHLVSHKYHDYDDNGNLLETYERSGTAGTGSKTRVLYEASYAGGLLDVSTDASGVQTKYFYDDYDRLTKRIVGYGATGSVQTLYAYDGTYRVTGQTVGTGDEELMTVNTFDTAGRFETMTDAAGLLTKYNYPDDTTEEMVYPSSNDAIKATTTFFKDGRRKAISGSAVPDMTYTHNYLSGTGELETKETLSTGKWSSRISDWTGRVARSQEPTRDGGSRYVYNFYNTLGQLYKQEYKNNSGTHLLPRTLYQYDSYGRLEYQGTDSDHDGVLDRDTDHNVVKFYSHFERLNSSDDWLLYEMQGLYPYENKSVNDYQTVKAYTQVGGFASNELARTFGWDFHDNYTDTTQIVDKSVRRLTARVSTPDDSGDDALQIFENGLLKSSETTQGHTYSYDYDTAGRIVSEIDPRLGSSNSTEYFYKTDSSQLETLVNTDGTKTDYAYYSDTGRLFSQRNIKAFGSINDQLTYLAYDAAGNVTHAWGNGTQPTKWTFNDLGQALEMHTYRSGSWSSSSLPSGFGSTGDKTTWSYHSTTGLLTSKSDAANQTTTFSHDDLDRVSQRTDARGVDTTYAYFDAAYAGSKEFTGALRQQVYDVSGTIAVATPTVAYKYHRNGGLKEVSDFTGTRTFDYYEDWSSGNANLGHSALLKKENLPAFYNGHDVEYDYHFDDNNQVNGLRKSFKVLDGSSSVYNVNSLYADKNRLSSVTPMHQSSQSFVYSYLANSNLVDRIDRDNNGSYEYHRNYDYASNSNRITRVLTDWNGTASADVRPTYDGMGRLDAIRLQGDVVTGLGTGDYGIYGLVESHQYTDRNEVDSSLKSQMTSTWGAGSHVRLNGVENAYRDYDYDQFGNRTLETEHYGNDFHTNRNNLNQYTSYGGQSFAYDANGNLTSDGKRTYKYDAENQLYEVVPVNPASGDLKILNKHDYLGRRSLKRVWEWTGSWTLKSDLSSCFVYDGWNLVAELQENGTLKKKYTWGNDVSGTAQGAGGVGGLLMIEIKEGGSFEQLYPIYDQSHNIRGLHDSSGAVVARYDYDTFGETFKANGSASAYNGDSNYAEANPFRHATKYTDNFSTDFPNKTDGMVYYGYRFYMPEIGRFLNRDPAEESGGLNLYGFVGNNPVNGYDYLGLSPGANNPFPHYDKGLDNIVPPERDRPDSDHPEKREDERYYDLQRDLAMARFSADQSDWENQEGSYFDYFHARSFQTGDPLSSGNSNARIEALARSGDFSNTNFVKQGGATDADIQAYKALITVMGNRRNQDGSIPFGVEILDKFLSYKGNEIRVRSYPWSGGGADAINPDRPNATNGVGEPAFVLTAGIGVGGRYSEPGGFYDRDVIRLPETVLMHEMFHAVLINQGAFSNNQREEEVLASQFDNLWRNVMGLEGHQRRAYHKGSNVWVDIPQATESDVRRSYNERLQRN